MTNIAVIILCKNEELHIGRCLERLMPLQPSEVFLIDCYSSDRTRIIAEMWGKKYEIRFGGKLTVIQHEWPGLYAKQFNWALENCGLTSDWVLRLDADEYLVDDAIIEIKQRLPELPSNVSLIELPLCQVWFGDVVKFGTGVLYLGRIFRRGLGKCEERYMDEHTVVKGGHTIRFKHPFVDDNLNTLDWWIIKHLGYARREAIDYFFGNSSGKKSFYNRLPLFGRCFAYFFYRYIIRGGFIEGKAGFTWHFFQGWWYRSLVDVNIMNVKKKVKELVRNGDTRNKNEIYKSVAEELLKV